MSDLTERLLDIWQNTEGDETAATIHEAIEQIDKLDYLTDEQVMLIVSQERRIKELKAWKAEGLQILDEWEAVYDAVKAHQLPEHLGMTKASVVANRINKLEAALREIKILASGPEQFTIAKSLLVHITRRALEGDEGIDHD
jgi:ABC-type transport system involved in cytochrome c biogenesis ATPase subunit